MILATRKISAYSDGEDVEFRREYSFTATAIPSVNETNSCATDKVTC